MKLWALAAIIVFSAETLTFKVNNSSDEFVMNKVDGGDYSMEYMYEKEHNGRDATLGFRIVLR